MNATRAAAHRLLATFQLLSGFLLLSGTGFAAAAGGGDAAGPFDGEPIVRIVCIRNNIFDTSVPGTSSWPYRTANSLHVVTREGFIRSMLLFEEGEAYSAQQAAESARMLRSLGFLNPVHITPRPVDGGVEVVVETHDSWTLEVGVQLSFFGNRSTTRVTFEEDSFLGWGREVSLEYESDNERDSWIVGLIDPNLLGSRWRAELGYEDSSDGSREMLRLERPFYALTTRHGWGIEYDNHERWRHLYSESTTRVTGRQHTERWRVWGGLRLDGRRNSHRSHRLLLGWEQRRDRFNDWTSIGDSPPYPAPEDRTIQGPRLEYRHIADRFVVLTGFRAWEAQEDVALGPNYRLGLTMSLPAFGGDRERLLLDGRAALARRRNSWLLLADGWFSGRLDEGHAKNWRFGIQLAAAQLGHRGWQARLLVETSARPDRDLQLTLGAENGLRGWDPDYFDGTGRAVANLQWRTLVCEDFLHLLSLGAVVFVDAGHTWGARVGGGTGRVRADIGVGLLADLKEINLARLLRLDVALPDDGSGVVVTVTASSLF